MSGEVAVCPKVFAEQKSRRCIGNGLVCRATLYPGYPPLCYIASKSQADNIATETPLGGDRLARSKEES